MAADQVIVQRGRPQHGRPGRRRAALRALARPPHWHLLGFDRYELRRAGQRRRPWCATARPASASATAIRSPRAALPGEAARARLHGAAAGSTGPALLGIREGISVGYGDDYTANLEGQYLPLDGPAPGRYVLVHRVNADRRLLESSYDNNASSLLLRLRWRRGEPRMRILGVCPDTERCTAER